MHREWGLPALLTGVCLASSCGGGGSDRSPFTPTVASWCQGPWSLSVSARGGAIAVGHSVSADALVFTPFDQQATFCFSHVASTRVIASVPGIVNVTPGAAPHRSILTGVTPGQTDLVAEVTMDEGSTLTTSGNSITVVPATTSN